MKIKSYKKLKKNLYEVSFFNKDSIVLYDDLILKYDLLLKKEINNKELLEIEKENLFLDCYYKAINYLSKKNHSKKEVEDYLKKHNFNKSIIDKTIDLLEEKKFINDYEYLKAFVNDQVNLTNNGPKKILNKLLDLGFKKEEIEDFLSTFSDEVWILKLKKIIEKKIASNHSDSIVKLREKIIMLGIRNGYLKEDVINVLDSMTFSDNDEILEKEMKKLYKKLSRKYDGNDLMLQLKLKLLNKGFTYEQVLKCLKKLNQ